MNEMTPPAIKHCPPNLLNERLFIEFNSLIDCCWIVDKQFNEHHGYLIYRKIKKYQEKYFIASEAL